MTYQLRHQSQYFLRAIWTEAELLIFGKLRLGIHPEQLERDLHKNLKPMYDGNDDYRILFRSISQRILDNLEGNDVFGDLPAIKEYTELVGVPTRKAEFEITMYHRFEDQEMLKKNALDDEVEADMAEDELLDSSCLEIVKTLHTGVTKDVEANYTANCKFLGENLSQNFAATTMDNPFMYGAVQKRWEGEGNRPGQYSLPTRPYLPPLKRRPRSPAYVQEIESENSSRSSAGSFFKYSTATESAAKAWEPSESSKALGTPETILPHTPENKTECPTFCMERLGPALIARPTSVGSPEKPKHPGPRPQGWKARITPKRPNIEPGCISLDTYFDVEETIPHQTSMQKSDGAQDSGGSERGRACPTLEKYTEWADDILRKVSWSGSRMANDQDGGEEEDSDWTKL